MSDIPEMVERVARAICYAPPYCEEQNNDDWKDWVPEARRVLEAMREPTVQMIEAAQSSYQADLEYGLGDQDMEKALTAAIDKALGK